MNKEIFITEKDKYEKLNDTIKSISDFSKKLKEIDLDPDEISNEIKTLQAEIISLESKQHLFCVLILELEENLKDWKHIPVDSRYKLSQLVKLAKIKE